MIAILALSIALLHAARADFDPMSDDFIDAINSKQTTWKAGRNFPKDTTLAHIKMRLGARLDKRQHSLLPIKRHNIDENDLPENFDPRQKWPNCPSLNEIRDQGCCGSCWAFGAVSAMTDRVCIYSNGTQHFHFSAQDLVSCATYVGGCHGGTLYAAWKYWVHKGLVSGGGLNSNKGCKPYEIAGDPNENPCLHFEPTPPCKKECRKGYGVEYENDKRYGQKVYIVRKEIDYSAELYLHGPIEVAFNVYEDFIHYKTGVYQHTSGNCIGAHAVKMLGWGVENGVKYWLCANSWNTTWGDKGYFKILRGKNECDIETNAIAGEPKL